MSNPELLDQINDSETCPKSFLNAISDASLSLGESEGVEDFQEGASRPISDRSTDRDSVTVEVDLVSEAAAQIYDDEEAFCSSNMDLVATFEDANRGSAAPPIGETEVVVDYHGEENPHSTVTQLYHQSADVNLSSNSTLTQAASSTVDNDCDSAGEPSDSEVCATASSSEGRTVTTTTVTITSSSESDSPPAPEEAVSEVETLLDLSAGFRHSGPARDDIIDDVKFISTNNSDTESERALVTNDTVCQCPIPPAAEGQVPAEVVEIPDYTEPAALGHFTETSIDFVNNKFTTTNSSEPAYYESDVCESLIEDSTLVLEKVFSSI